MMVFIYYTGGELFINITRTTYLYIYILGTQLLTIRWQCVKITDDTNIMTFATFNKDETSRPVL